MKGPIELDADKNPYYKEDAYLQILIYVKFMLMIFVMITITASYLNAVTADNPWSL